MDRTSSDVKHGGEWSSQKFLLSNGKSQCCVVSNAEFMLRNKLAAFKNSSSYKKEIEEGNILSVLTQAWQCGTEVKKKRIFTGMLLRETVQSWVRGPVVFTEAKTTKTLENRAEKLSSTSTPQRNISRLFRGSSERRNESYCLFFLNIPQTTLFFTFSHLPDRFNLVKDRLRHPQTDNIWRSSLQMWKNPW